MGKCWLGWFGVVFGCEVFSFWLVGWFGLVSLGLGLFGLVVFSWLGGLGFWFWWLRRPSK